MGAHVQTQHICAALRINPDWDLISIFHSARADPVVGVLSEILNGLEHQAFLQSDTENSLVSYPGAALLGISRRQGESPVLNNSWIHKDFFFFEQAIILWKLRLIKSNTILTNALSYLVRTILYLLPVLLPCAP